MRMAIRLVMVFFLSIIVSETYADDIMIGNVQLSNDNTGQATINLDVSTSQYVAFQFDIVLPEGITITKNETGEILVSQNTERLSGHQLYCSEIEANKYRVLAFSMTNAEILGAEGSLVDFTLKANKNISCKECYIDNILFVKTDGKGVGLGKKTFAIIEAPVTVTANSYTKVYGDENPTFEYTSEGATLNGTPTISCEATVTSPVGVYPITIVQGDVTNENVTYVNGTLTITKAPLTIKAGEYTKKQGEDNPEFTLTYEGFKNEETLEVLTTQPTISCDAKKDSPVGEYPVTVSGAEATNYDISYVNGKLTISEAPIAITVTAKSYSRVYGEENPAFEYTAEGGELSGTPAITCDATATSPVGTYPITITQGDVTSENVTYINGTLTITKAPLTIKAGEYTKKVGEDNPEFTLTYEEFKNEETLEVLTTQPTISCDATKDSPIGEYPVTVSGAEATNYEISYVNGKLTIDGIIFVYGGDETNDENDPASYEIITGNSVAIIDDADVTGMFAIPDTVVYNGTAYIVTEIAANTFENNTNLTDVSIPSTITVIGSSAFGGCLNLKSITDYNATPIALSTAATRGIITRSGGSSIFEGVDKETCILYVPEESIDLYKAADVWKEFVNILAIGISDGINGIIIDDGKPFDVYDLQGRKVKTKVTTLKGLPKGVYIVNGKKVVLL